VCLCVCVCVCVCGFSRCLQQGTYVNYGFRPLTVMADRIAMCASDADVNTSNSNGTDTSSNTRTATSTSTTSSGESAEEKFTSLMDSFFGYGRDPSVQLPIVPGQSGRWTSWASDLNKAGYDSHTFEGLCNEPDMETPYSYAYARRADRVQEVVAAVKA
jgi:hypothetical protein